MRRFVSALVGISISAAAIAVVVASIDVRETWNIVAAADPLPLVLIVLIVGVQMAIRSWRWSFLFPHDERGRRVSVPRLLPPLLVGYLGNAVLPARLGEPMRAVLASRRERVGMTEALGSVVLERFIDVATLAFVAFGAVVVVGAPDWVARLIGATALAGVIGLATLLTVGIRPVVVIADHLGIRRFERVRSLIGRFAASVGGPSRRGPIAVSAGISIGAWLLDAVSFWLAAWAVGVELAYPAALLIAGFTVLGTAIPSAPGYLGTFELAAVAIGGTLGVPAAPALAMAVVAHVMTLTPMALGGAASLPIIGTSLATAAHDAAQEADSAGRRDLEAGHDPMVTSRAP